MPLLIKCSSPFVAPRHPHLRAPPHICCHVCHAHARPCLNTGWALNRRFDLTFGTASVLAQGGGGVRPPQFRVPNPVGNVDQLCLNVVSPSLPGTDIVCNASQPSVFTPLSFSAHSHAHWEPYGCGSLPLHNLFSDSANPTVSCLG